MVMLATLAMFLSVALSGQAADSTEKEDAVEDKAAAAERLDFMKKSTAVYRVTRETGKKDELKLQPEPALRWNNPVSSVPDGTLFLWVGADGRPELAAQVFIAAGTKDLWLHEFQSLSVDTFDVVRDGRSQWHPRKPGVELKSLSDAPPPAESPAGRMTQMRTIARDFEASDDFEGKSRWELRLISKQLVRYGKEGSDILDGALFVFGHGTDPEVFLMLEARRIDGEYRWQYALAPMTAYALKVSRRGETVWSRPQQKPPFSAEEPYYILRYTP
jgi:hypothetical protein